MKIKTLISQREALVSLLNDAIRGLGLAGHGAHQRQHDLARRLSDDLVALMQQEEDETEAATEKVRFDCSALVGLQPGFHNIYVHPQKGLTIRLEVPIVVTFEEVMSSGSSYDQDPTLSASPIDVIRNMTDE